MPNENQALSTDKNVAWRVAKVAIEKYSRELGVILGNTRALRWLSQEVRRITHGQALPPHWIQSIPGILAGAWLQSPRTLSRLTSRITGLNEAKLNKLFNEGLDAGILAIAAEVEKNANRPPDAQEVTPETDNLVDQALNALRERGTFDELRVEGEKFLPVIIRIMDSEDETERNLAESFFDQYLAGNAHHRAVFEDIGQKLAWQWNEVSVLLRRAGHNGVIDLDALERFMSLNVSRSRARRAAAFLGAALTGDPNNPDFGRVLEDVNRLTARVERSVEESDERLAIINEVLDED
jgi:hypothetical protein